MHLHIVVGIEAGQEIRGPFHAISVQSGGAKICADQTVAIHGME